MTTIHNGNREMLDAMGYQSTPAAESFDSDGSITRVYEVQSMRPIRAPVGDATEYTPPANLAVVSLEYVSEHWPDKFSRAAARFADALVKLLATPDGPLVRRTPRSVEFVYRLEDAVAPRLDDLSLSHAPPLFQHGLAARDLRATLMLNAGCPYIPVSDASEWLDGRSPLTVARTALPELDADATSIAVVGLVNEWAARGDLRICGPYVEPSYVSSEPVYGGLDRSISTDPNDWDPMDPRRKDSGLIARVRALREKIMGGTPSRRIDNDELVAKLEQQRAAARGQMISSASSL